MDIGTKLRAANNRPSGFDYMRVILAFSVLWMHTARVSYGSDAFLWSSPLRPFLKAILPLFFALSGFLVAGSLERSRSLITFIGNRVIRIYPALTVEVVLSAFLLGPVFTTLSLSGYFSSSIFHIYLLNALGNIHFYLPGVFANNPDSGVVNMQLWTVPFELGCYIAIAILFLLGTQRRPSLAPIGAVLMIIAFMIYRWHVEGNKFPVFPNVVPGPFLVSAFLFGVTLYLYRDRIPFKSSYFAISVMFIFGMFYFTNLGDLFCPLAFAYITIYLGLCNPKRIKLLRHADYSYGVFLYGFAIQQAIAALFPWSHVWYVNGLMASVIASLFAAFSWHFIELPALHLRKPLLRIEGTALRHAGPITRRVLTP